ncbi:5'-nucleotidase C-terminal domain-containing protein [uncultured Porphyromonas sp.]|uniref:bifunctional metallophosphatase/5'-nucleotidase n=1 Tax=uncultured Porphyromonas sp. TaxID=159274 RepID=UPI00259357EC|nr:5'-nucleotidase C-terminal domain-containing protein [uncultured Porphyromonas sp.]
MRKYLVLILTLIANCTALSAQEEAVKILYFNDAHEPDMVSTEGGLLGGVARMKTVVDSIRQSSPDALLLFGGDLGGGTLAGKLYRGTVMVDFLGDIGVDYANYGQHDFDYGLDNTQALTRRSKFTWISSNTLTTEGSPIDGSVPFVIHKIGSTSIGIIGLVDKVDTSSPRSGITQRDIMDCAKSAIGHLSGVDYIIAITQMNSELNEQLLRECPEVDLVLGEETSQYITNVHFVGDKMIIDGCGNMGHLIEISLPSEQGSQAISVHPISTAVKPDERLERRVQAINDEIASRLGVRLGTVPLDHIRTRHQIGEMVAGIFREHYGTDMALVQSGGIRADLTDGDITLRDIYSILPYENRIIPVRLPGRSIRRLIEKAVNDGADAALAGVEVTSSDEALTIYVNGVRLDDSRDYTIALSEYVTSGGGGFDVISENSYMMPLDKADKDSDILIKYFTAL